MQRIRIATAVLVTREGPDGAEVLVVRRNPALRFFGGYWAFPGGVIDDADGDPGEGGDDTDDAHRRCALREVLEEVGFDGVGLGADAAELRARLLERATEAAAAREFRGRLDALGAGVLAQVRPFARLTTPPFAPMLYRTRFVHLAVPADFEPALVTGELVDAAFRRPVELLGEWRAGRHLIAPPVVFMLEHLAELGLAAFLERVPALAEELEAGKLHPIRNVPGIIMAPLATETLPPATTTNAYLIGEARFYVVDPAPVDADELERLAALIDDRIARGADFVGIVLTHHHPDHVGGAEPFARRYDVPVLAHAKTFERLRARPNGFDVANTRTIADGVVLPLGEAPDGSLGWTLTAYHTPGHAPGHLVLRESRYGAVIAGDLVSTVSTIVIDPPEGHLATYLASLARVREMMEPGQVLHPAHGPVASDGRRVIERYIEHRARREDALVGALAAQPGGASEADLVGRVYADVEDSMLGIAGRSMRAGLEKLSEEGRAEEFEPRRWRATPDAAAAEALGEPLGEARGAARREAGGEAGGEAPQR